MKRPAFKQIMVGTASALACLAGLAAHAQDIDWKGKLADQAGKTLKLISISDPFIEAIKATKDDFTKLTGAKVEVDGNGYDALHDKELLNCSQNDSSYDVLLIDGIWIGEFVEAGCIDALDDRIAKEDPKVIAWDDYTSSGAGQASWDNKKYCLPVAIYYELMYYRTDLFEKAKMQPPKTFDELQKAAKFFTNNPDFPGVYGYAMNNQRGAAAGQQYFEWIFNAGGSPWKSNVIGAADPYADMTPTLNSPESLDLVQFFKDMVKFGPPGVESYAWDERASAFASGKLAMMNDWSVRAQIANDPKTSQIAGKFGSVLMPSKAGKPVPPVGGWVMCLNAHGTQKDAAWDFMKWYASPAEHKRYALAGGTPSRLSAINDAEVQAKFPWTKTIAEAQKTAWTEVRPRIPATFQLIDTIGVNVNKAIIGEMSVKDAMDDANAKATQLLKSSGALK
ncbi:extracellular solute-binding protein [Labrys sp. 22185]|uniref:extracellular solute-binding protein n=1 Tax=Labrys sp. 22185 TaxID=3453888 RepID=UPI003F851D8A